MCIGIYVCVRDGEIEAENPCNGDLGVKDKCLFCRGVALILTFRNNLFCAFFMNILEKSLKP